MIPDDVFGALRLLADNPHYLDLADVVLVVDFDQASAIAYAPGTFRVDPVSGFPEQGDDR